MADNIPNPDNKKMSSEVMKLAWEIRKANIPGGNKEIVDTLKEQNKENDLKKKEEKMEMEMFFENLLDEFGKTFSDARSEVAKPFKDVSLLGIGKLLLGAIPALAAGIIAGVFGSVTGLLSKIPVIQKIGKFFGLLTTGVIPNLVKSLVGKFPRVQKFFGFIGKIINVVGKILRPVMVLAKFGLKALKPLFSSFGKILSVFFKFGSALGRLFLPVTIVWGIVEGLIASWDRFAEGDIVGGVGAFLGGILDFFTFGIIDVEKFTAWWDSLFGNFIGFFKKLFDGDILGALKDLGNFLLDWFVGLPEMLFDGILNAIGSIFEFFGMDDMGQWFKELAEVDILGTIKGVVGHVKFLFNQVTNTIAGVIEWIAGLPIIGDIIGGVADFVVGGGGGGVNPRPSNTGIELQRESTRGQMATVPQNTDMLSPTQNNNVITHVENNSYSQPPLNPRNDFNPHKPQM